MTRVLLTGSKCERMPGAKELGAALSQGRLVAKTARRLHGRA